MEKRHVPSLELCQELDRLCKEKGIVVPETEYSWYKNDVGGDWELIFRNPYHGCITAPLVSEQGEWLPNERRDKLAFFSGLAINGWFCEVKNYRVMPYERFHVILQEYTEANARQKMINYLIAEGIITTL